MTMIRAKDKLADISEETGVEIFLKGVLTFALLISLTGCSTDAIIQHAGTKLTIAEAEKLLSEYEQQLAYLKEQNELLKSKLATPEQVQMQEDVRRLKSMLLPSDNIPGESSGTADK